MRLFRLFLPIMAALLLGLLTRFALAQGRTPQATTAVTLAIPAAKDNTLFAESGNLSNGQGQYLFVGNTQAGDPRRALLAFDVAGNLPPGATVLSASLRLRLSKTIVGDQAVTLHPLLRDWGESESNAPGEEGTGTAAATGDATWSHAFTNTVSWTTPGGDFAPTASATTLVGSNAVFYTWSSPQMTADVQAWLDNAAGNFGWLLRGNEGVSPSAKRFDSVQNPTAANRPVLLVTFEAPPTAPVTVTLAGPTNGLTTFGIPFTATVSPLYTTQPITYHWRATDGLNVTFTVNAYTHSIPIIWATTGPKTITVTASNSLGAVTNTHTITISAPPNIWLLPMIKREG